MVRYIYSWAPLVIVATVALLAAPWLGLIALAIVALGAISTLATLAWAVVFVPFMLGRAISRRVHRRSGASPRTAAALSPASGQNEPIWHGASPHAPTLSVARDPQAPQHSFRNGHAA